MPSFSKIIDPLLEDVIGQTFRGTHTDWQSTAQMKDLLRAPNAMDNITRQKLDTAHAVLASKMQAGDPNEWATYASRSAPLDYGTSGDTDRVGLKDIPGEMQSDSYLAHSHPVESKELDIPVLPAEPLSSADMMTALINDMRGITSVDHYGGVSHARAAESEEAAKLLEYLMLKYTGGNKTATDLINDIDLIGQRGIGYGRADIGLDTSAGHRPMGAITGRTLGLGHALQKHNIIEDYGYRAGDYKQQTAINVGREHARASASAYDKWLTSILMPLLAVGVFAPDGGEVEDAASVGA